MSNKGRRQSLWETENLPEQYAFELKDKLNFRLFYDTEKEVSFHEKMLWVESIAVTAVKYSGPGRESVLRRILRVSGNIWKKIARRLTGKSAG